MSSDDEDEETVKKETRSRKRREFKEKYGVDESTKVILFPRYDLRPPHEASSSASNYSGAFCFLCALPVTNLAVHEQAVHRELCKNRRAQSDLGKIYSKNTKQIKAFLTERRNICAVFHVESILEHCGFVDALGEQEKANAIELATDAFQYLMRHGIQYYIEGNSSSPYTLHQLRCLNYGHMLALKIRNSGLFVLRRGHEIVDLCHAGYIEHGMKYAIDADPKARPDLRADSATNVMSQFALPMPFSTRYRDEDIRTRFQINAKEQTEVEEAYRCFEDVERREMEHFGKCLASDDLRDYMDERRYLKMSYMCLVESENINALKLGRMRHLTDAYGKYLENPEEYRMINETIRKKYEQKQFVGTLPFIMDQILENKRISYLMTRNTTSRKRMASINLTNEQPLDKCSRLQNNFNESYSPIGQSTISDNIQEEIPSNYYEVTSTFDNSVFKEERFESYSLPHTYSLNTHHNPTKIASGMLPNKRNENCDEYVHKPEEISTKDAEIESNCQQSTSHKSFQKLITTEKVEIIISSANDDDDEDFTYIELQNSGTEKIVWTIDASLIELSKNGREFNERVEFKEKCGILNPSGDAPHKLYFFWRRADLKDVRAPCARIWWTATTAVKPSHFKFCQRAFISENAEVQETLIPISIKKF